VEVIAFHDQKEEVLLPMAALMTMSECKVGRNKDRKKLFGMLLNSAHCIVPNRQLRSRAAYQTCGESTLGDVKGNMLFIC